MLIGYGRVSTKYQNTDRQIDALKIAGCERLFIDKLSGKNTNRPELLKMFDMLRQGDVVIVSELSRLGRSVKDLITIIEKINATGADFKALDNDNMNTQNSSGKFIFTICAAFAEFQRNIIIENTKEGLAAARARGRIGGRPSVNAAALEKAIRLYTSKDYSIKEITEMTGISRSTLYHKLHLKQEN